MLIPPPALPKLLMIVLLTKRFGSDCCVGNGRSTPCASSLLIGRDDVEAAAAESVVSPEKMLFATDLLQPSLFPLAFLCSCCDFIEDKEEIDEYVLRICSSSRRSSAAATQSRKCWSMQVSMYVSMQSEGMLPYY